MRYAAMGHPPLVGQSSGCRWMCHIAGVFCLHGVFVDMLSSVPDLSVVSSSTVSLAEPLCLLSQETLPQCPGRIASWRDAALTGYPALAFGTRRFQ